MHLDLAIGKEPDSPAAHKKLWNRLSRAEIRGNSASGSAACRATALLLKPYSNRAASIGAARRAFDFRRRVGLRRMAGVRGTRGVSLVVKSLVYA